MDLQWRALTALFLVSDNRLITRVRLKDVDLALRKRKD